MSKAPNPYTRVPGLGSSVYEYSRLYLASDHLLLVGTSAWNESYRRFFFRDIQAVIIRKTQWGLFTAALWLLGFFAFAGIALGIGDNIGAVIFWFIAGSMIVGMVVDLSRGPACTCYIKTAVQTTKLGPLKRVRAAQRFLGQLRPLIAAAQGEATSAAPAADSTAAPTPSASSDSPPPTAGP